MPLFKTAKKEKTSPQSQNQNQGANAAIAQMKPGERIAAVMGRMYRLIVSADLEMNSCFVEEGELKLGEIALERTGTYDKFYEKLVAAAGEDDRVKVVNIFARQKLQDIFLSGRSCVSTLVNFATDICEVRTERIPELDEKSTRVRCCIYIRPVLSADDDGRSVQDESEEKKELVSASEKVIKQIFVGSYEFSTATNTLTGFRELNGLFVRMNSKENLKGIIENYIEKGYVGPESIPKYQNLLKKGFLEKNTIGRPYEMQVRLRRPGTDDYRWYEDMIMREGNMYRVYRRDIDSVRRAMENSQQAQEHSKLEAYNRNMLEKMASLVEFRNAETGPHITNVRQITEILLLDITNRSPDYNLTRTAISQIAEASVLHDIGKITIPDAILNKPGRFTPDEFEVMKTHTTTGGRILDTLETPDQKDLYTFCRDIVRHHHERWDGKGYPDGISGNDISIGAQTVGLADVFDALVSVRCYKEPYPPEVALEMIREGQCGTFNPRLLESLTACFDKICELYPHIIKRSNSRENDVLNEAVKKTEESEE